jgi:hypothetical protein
MDVMVESNEATRMLTQSMALAIYGQVKAKFNMFHSSACVRPQNFKALGPIIDIRMH